MKAAVYHGPEDLRFEAVPDPEPAAGEIVARVLAASICGTDVRILHGNHRLYAPGTVRIPGHEVVAEIVEVGTGVRGIREGGRYFIAPNIGCGRCRECISGNNNRCAGYQAIGITMDGAFAELLKITEPYIVGGNLFPVDERVDPAVAALTEPFACVVRGQARLNIRPGDVVLILGAGPIGIMHAKLARLSGAKRVIVSDPNPERGRRAAELGADVAVNPELQPLAEVVAAHTGGRGADVIIVAAPSHAAQEQALELAGTGARINFFGGLPKDRPTINFDSNLLHYKELVVTATTACSTLDCARAADLVNDGSIDLAPLVSVRRPLSEVNAAFEDAQGGRVLKVVLEPRGGQ